jgi:hypothetical protein
VANAGDRLRLATIDAEGKQAESMALAFAFQVLDAAAGPEAEALVEKLGGRSRRTAG